MLGPSRASLGPPGAPRGPLEGPPPAVLDVPSPPTLQFVRNVGPRMSGPVPRDPFDAPRTDFSFWVGPGRKTGPGEVVETSGGRRCEQIAASGERVLGLTRARRTSAPLQKSSLCLLIRCTPTSSLTHFSYRPARRPPVDWRPGQAPWKRVGRAPERLFCASGRAARSRA